MAGFGGLLPMLAEVGGVSLELLSMLIEVKRVNCTQALMVVGRYWFGYVLWDWEPACICRYTWRVWRRLRDTEAVC